MFWSKNFSKGPSHLNHQQCKSLSRGNVVCKLENDQCVCTINPGLCSQLSNGNVTFAHCQNGECVCDGPTSLSPTQCSSLSSTNITCQTDSSTGQCVCAINDNVCGRLSNGNVTCTMENGKCVCTSPQCPVCPVWHVFKSFFTKLTWLLVELTILTKIINVLKHVILKLSVGVLSIIVTFCHFRNIKSF